MPIVTGGDASSAGALDLLTLTEAKRAINLATTDTTQDDELRTLVAAVSLRLDRLCGPVVRRTVTDEPYDGGTTHLFLRHAPAAATSATTITAVKEYSGTSLTTLAAESVGTQPSAGYSFEQRTGILTRRAGGVDGTFADGRQNVLVTYSAGRYADTASVAANFKQAAAITLAHVWRLEQGFAGVETELVGTGFAFPRRALEFIRDEIQAAV